MLRYVLIFTVLGATNSEDIVNLVDELLKDGGKWILAGIGTTGQSPPSESCVHITITDTGDHSECILANHNVTPHNTRIIRMYGVNENDHVEIITQGPVHQYMIKGLLNKTVNDAVKDEVDFDTAINSPFCWHTHDHAIHDFRFIIAPIDKTTDHILLIGVRVRMPVPEYQVAILTKTKIKADELEQMTHDVNDRNHWNLKASCMIHDVDQEMQTLIPYCLPRVYKRCAEGIHWQNNTDPAMYVWDTPNDVKDMDTVLVKHLSY